MRLHDWRYAFRALRRSPRFTAAAVVALAVGIGANAAIFSIINAVYLRPLPYPDPGRLVALWETGPKIRGTGSSAAAYLGWQGQTQLFSSVAAWSWDVVTLSGGAFPERLQVQRISDDYLRALGVSPHVGRSFLPEDGCALLVGPRLAESGYLPGKTALVDRAPCQVVGVMPAGFAPPLSASSRLEVWMPLRLAPAQIANRNDRGLQVLARLAPGVSLPQAQGRMPSGERLVSLKERVSGRFNPALWALAGAAAFLLLIGCLNVATLMSARAGAQTREIAIRAALGASRRELIAHLFAQALSIALLGGAAGLVLAWWSMDAVIALANGALPRLHEARVDWRVLAFTAAISLFTGLLFGLAPAVAASRSTLVSRMQRAGRQRLRSLHIALQVAVAFVLLTGAGLLLRSFHAIRSVDLGFQVDRVLAANFAQAPSRYTDPTRYLQFLSDVLERVRAIPGVVAVTATTGVPMRGSAGASFAIDGRDGAPIAAELRPADSGYLAAFGMALERGRPIASTDADGTLPVALVNQRFARELFPGEDPLGRQVRVVSKSGALPWMTIVGVVRDTRHLGPLRDTLLEVYAPYAQFHSTEVPPRALVVRASGPPERLVTALQRAVASVDKDQPLVGVAPMERDLAEFLAPQRFDTAITAIFAAIGLILTAVGIFGVTWRRLEQRTFEIGVRLAVGARGEDVVRMALGEAVRAACAGVAVGLAGSWAVSRFIATLLFGVQPRDPLTLIVVAALSLGITAIAAWLPARRASRIDPVIALRTQ